MIYLITKFHNDFIHECRRLQLNYNDPREVMFLNTYVKLLGRRIKPEDTIITGPLYGFSSKEWIELCREIGIRKTK